MQQPRYLYTATCKVCGRVRKTTRKKPPETCSECHNKQQTRLLSALFGRKHIIRRRRARHDRT